MYKAKILQKIKSVAEAHKNKVKDESFLSIECKDCKARGHFNKAYHECKFYKAVSAADVGSSGKKRKQSATVKEEKKQAKRKKKQTTGDIKCISCGLKGHSTSRSLECPNHIASKEEVITSTLGEGSTVFTRKLPLTSAVKPAFREQFQEKIISCCSDIRRIVFSSQLFVNSKKDSKEANKDRSIPDVFCQQFWYSVVKHKLTVGYSHCLTEAAKELSVSYTNSIVERFEQRLTKFLTYKLRTMLPVRL
ncbi:hypothetical protein BDF20DRAFT_948019 [Mycotypha africana]|uniref:uncharacterized protein n=1 Tax=Mycotypha africana TaxID=64632 RepID=UPI0023017CFE|nr:uncharacterized protein BDF20DRAFT_948019 [Mycotypha africana]KAI8971765.1 hypothetical protein BDF20DRAFT_948019 [Mycotypha africana]